MFFDNHTHQKPFSFDAAQTIGQLLECADRKGLAGVCTTDHYEKELYYDGGREDIFSLDDYFAKLLPIKNSRPAGSAQLFLGVEFGYLPHLTGHLVQIANQYPFDSIILSLHILDGEDPYTDQDMFSAGKIKLYSRCLSRQAEMLRLCPGCDILGHFDYISRYAPFQDRKMRYAEMPAVFDNLIRTLVDLDIAMEINTRTTQKFLSLGYPLEDAWPDPAIIRRYLESGGKLISIGSDAHKPADAGNLIPECASWLKRLGCSQLVHYEKRKPVFTTL